MTIKDLIAELKTQLGEIDGIQEVFMNRDSEPKKYPSITCLWDTLDNTFETTNENMKQVQFRLFIQVNVAGQTMEKVDEVIIPNAFDKVTEYFDENWNFGTSVQGHRMWSRLSLANSGIAVEDKSKIAYLDCVLQIKFLTDN